MKIKVICPNCLEISEQEYSSGALFQGHTIPYKLGEDHEYSCKRIEGEEAEKRWDFLFNPSNYAKKYGEEKK